MSVLRATLVFAGLALLVPGLAGCARFDGPGERLEQAEDFERALAARTGDALDAEGPLDLDACLKIAFANNLELESARIDARIAELKRREAFANFLPRIELSYRYVELDRAPENKIVGPLYSVVQDRIVRETAVQSQLPVFVPVTWYLYAAHQRGEEIAALVRDYVRQRIALEVAAAYYHCVALEESRAALAAQVTAAEAMLKEMGALHEEGLVPGWQRDAAATMLDARRFALERNADARKQAAADLLAQMGMSPLAALKLEVGSPLVPPAGAVEDWIARALREHPVLAIADREVAIAGEQVRMAIAAFLPQLVGFASRTNSSNSFLRYPDFTTTGLSGVLSLFDGFANINAYRAARAGKEQAEVDREQRCFTVMTSIVRAWLNVRDASRQVELAGRALAVEEARVAEIEARWAEGLVQDSNRLDAAAARDEARVNTVLARYQEQVALAALRFAMGDAYLGETGESDAGGAGPENQEKDANHVS